MLHGVSWALQGVPRTFKGGFYCFQECSEEFLEVSKLVHDVSWVFQKDSREFQGILRSIRDVPGGFRCFQKGDWGLFSSVQFRLNDILS